MDNAKDEDESIVARLKRRSNAKQLDFKHLLKKCSSSDCDCHQQHTPKAAAAASSDEVSPQSQASGSRSLRSRPSVTSLAKDAAEQASPVVVQKQEATKSAKQPAPTSAAAKTNGKKIRCQVHGKNVLVDESDFNKYIRHGKWQSGEFFRYELQSKCRTKLLFKKNNNIFFASRSQKRGNSLKRGFLLFPPLKYYLN
jgi:ribosomal protein S6E (S10)